MPRRDDIRTRRPMTRSQLIDDLARLGVRPALPTMVHASMSALGWVVGGSQTLVEALLERLGTRGTLCAQASWEDIPFGLEEWPVRWRQAYTAEMPGFDAELSAAAPYEGRLAERIRTWPGARRSGNPASGSAAVGAAAECLTRDHRLDDGFGAGTPYARIVAADGQVLVPRRAAGQHEPAAPRGVGRPRTETLDVPAASRRESRRVVWRRLRELDVWVGPVAYEKVVASGEAPLAHVGAQALAAGVGRRGLVGEAHSFVFPARNLVEFAVTWLEAKLGKPDS